MTVVFWGQSLCPLSKVHSTPIAQLLEADTEDWPFPVALPVG